MSKEMREEINKVKNFGEFLNETHIVFRGIPKGSIDASPNQYIWVSDDEDFASIYSSDNIILKYNIPSDLKIVDINANFYLLDDFGEENDIDEIDDLKYEPTNEFIQYLTNKGYDGFINNDNILIFDKSKITRLR